MILLAQATWTDPALVTAVLVLVTGLIGALATAATKIIGALGEVKQQQRTQAEALVVVAKDTEAIKGHVNSEKTASEGREAAMKMEIQLLREQLADEKVTKRLLAQAAALVPALAVAPGLQATPELVLDKIETNTSATAANTARTDAAVTDLQSKS